MVSLRLMKRISVRLAILLPLGVSLRGQELAPTAVMALPECSLAKTNNTCRLTIDRANLIAPPTVQMYSNQRVVVVIKNPKNYERYFLDYQTGQATLTPDVAQGIVQNLLTPLAKFGEFTALLFNAPPAPPPVDPCTVPEMSNVKVGHVQEAERAFEKCLGKLADEVVDIYHELEPSLAPDSRTPGGETEDPDFDAIETEIEIFVNAEAAVSAKMAVILNDSSLKGSATDAPAMFRLASLQKTADSVASDLMGYGTRIRDLSTFDNGARDCNDLMPAALAGGSECVYISSRSDNSHVYDGIVTRTITYAVSALNVIANSRESAPDPSKKKSLATITLNFADVPTHVSLRSPFRWELSLGAFFSTLPIRSFSVAPVFTGTVITDKVVSQNVLHPTVVPSVGANYRLSDDLKWTRWRSAIYWTGVAGINPNTTSADFATGPSLSWRSVMFSAFCHFGHDVRLRQGLQVGESLGPSFNGSLPTKTYWTASFAFGVSIRTAALTGR